MTCKTYLKVINPWQGLNNLKTKKFNNEVNSVGLWW